MSTNDKSKARWPDGMKWCSPNAIILNDETEVVYLPSEDLSGNNSDVGEMINRHRFGQIVALPKMVELLIELEKERIWLKTPQGEQQTELRTPLGGKAYAILREIGEAE